MELAADLLAVRMLGIADATLRAKIAVYQHSLVELVTERDSALRSSVG